VLAIPEDEAVDDEDAIEEQLGDILLFIGSSIDSI
jgi:hypothetical protein